MPASESGGTPPIAATRCAVDTPSPRSFPPCTSASAGGMSANMKEMCPPIRSLSAGAVPLYGT